MRPGRSQERAGFRPIGEARRVKTAVGVHVAVSRQVDHEPAHGAWICGSARSSMVGKSPTQRGADLAIRPPFLRLINSDQ